MAVKDTVESEKLRQRNVPVQASSSEEAREVVLQLNALEEKANKNDNDKKTYGRTPDGTGTCLVGNEALPSRLARSPVSRCVL